MTAMPSVSDTILATVGLILLAGAAPTAAEQALATHGPLVVGTARAVAGAKTRGAIVAGEHVDGTPLTLPVEIVTGRDRKSVV